MAPSFHRSALVLLLAVGCAGARSLPTPGQGAVRHPPFERSDCGLRLVHGQPQLPGGTLLIASEESFRAHFACYDGDGKPVDSPSGVDFTRDVLAVFGAFGDDSSPRLTRLEHSGDRLTAVFSVEPYCGGAQPFPRLAVYSFVVPREPLTLESRPVLQDRGACPKDLP